LSFIFPFSARSCAVDGEIPRSPETARSVAPRAISRGVSLRNDVDQNHRNIDRARWRLSDQ
jgi:hypothetical protein